MSNNPGILSSVRIAQRLLPGQSEGSIYGGGIAPQGTRKLLDCPNLASWMGLSGGATSFRWPSMPSVASPDQTAGDLRTQKLNIGWDLTHFVPGGRHGDDAAKTEQPFGVRNYSAFNSPFNSPPSGSLSVNGIRERRRSRVAGRRREGHGIGLGAESCRAVCATADARDRPLAAATASMPMAAPTVPGSSRPTASAPATTTPTWCFSHS
jgi:hypothetical protein